MKIECKAENYKYIISANKVFFYNELYNNKSIALFFTAIVEALIPDVNSFDLPLAVEVEISNDTISLEKELEVHGTNKYSYFIPLEHYNKWKKTYAFIYWCIILIELLICCILMYIFVGPSNFNWLVGIIIAVFLLMIGFLFYKFQKQLKLLKKYPIKHIILK